MVTLLSLALCLVLGMAALPWSYRARVGEYGRRIRFKARVGGGLPGTGGTGWTVPPVITFEARKPSGRVVAIAANFYVVSLATCEFDWEPVDSGVLDESGDWEFTASVIHGTESYPCDTVSLSVGPGLSTAAGSVASAYGTASQINAQIAALAATATADNPAALVFPVGTWSLDDNIDLASHVYITGSGRYATRVTSSITGGDDDPTNAVFRATGVVGSLATTITAIAYKGATSIVLASATGLAAGEWLRLTGKNVVLGSQAQFESDGIFVEYVEVVQIDDSYVSGTTIPLKTQLRQYHASGTSVVDYVPVEDTGISNLFLDCEDGDVAVGLHVRGGVGCFAEDVRGRGFSKSIVFGDHGARDGRYSRVRGMGQCNSGVGFISGHDNVTLDLSSDPDGERYHANGVPRGFYFERFGCTGNTLDGLRAYHVCRALQFTGSKFGTFKNIHAVDLDATRAHTQAQAAGEHDGGDYGVVLESDADTIDYAEFAQSCTIETVIAEQITALTAETSWPIFLHDNYRMLVRDIQLGNFGAATRTQRGVLIHDCIDLTVEGAIVRGIPTAFRVKNDPQTVLLRDVTCDAGGSPDGAATIAFEFHQNSNVGGFVVDGLKMAGYAAGTQFAFGGDFDNTCMATLELRNVRSNYMLEGVIGRAICVNNQAGAADLGYQATAVVELLAASAAGDRRIGTPSGAGLTRVAVTMGGCPTGSGYCFVQDPAYGGVVAVDAAVNFGDMLINGGADIFANADNAPANPHSVFGRSLTDIGGAGSVAYAGK